MKPLGNVPQPQIVATHIRHELLIQEGPTSFAQKWSQKRKEALKSLYGAKETPKVESSIGTKVEATPLTPDQSLVVSFYESAPSGAVNAKILKNLPEHAKQEASQRRQQFQGKLRQEFGEIVQSIKSVKQEAH